MFRRPGITLIELVVVLVIIALLLGLLFPAIHFARERARRTACASNLHQIGVAFEHFFETHNKAPDPASDGRIGGWVVAILPFMEETHLADALSGNPPLDPLAPLASACKRPYIITCPSAYDGDSSVATVPVSHYSVIFLRQARVDKLQWTIGELPTDSRVPWVFSPELPFVNRGEVTPHRGGFNTLDGFGKRAFGVRFHILND